MKITNAQRVHLDRQLAREGFAEIEPHGEPPGWLWQFDARQPRVWTMRLDGVPSAGWDWLDAVDWTDVVAIRMEHDHGQPIDVARLCEDDEVEDFDGDEEDAGEPAIPAGVVQANAEAERRA
jgi:hypothetical protein